MEIRREREIGLSREVIWELLSDNDHLNRYLGLSAVTPLDISPELHVMTRQLGGFAAGLWPMEWRESPFDWIRHEWYEVLREYNKGPMKTFRSGIRLKEGGQLDSDRTVVELYSYIEPMTPLAAPIVKLAALQAMGRTFRYLEEASRLQGDQPGYRPQAGRKSKVNQDRLLAAKDKLLEAPVDSQLADKLAHFIHTQHDNEIVQIRPYVLADKWKTDRREMLRVCLHGTKAGLLNLEWLMICPNCRVQKQEAGSLAKLTESYHCDWCGIHYDLQFDRYVELVFRVHPSIRLAEQAIFCVGSPAFVPHIYAQYNIEPGQTVTLSLPQLVSALQLRVLRFNEKAEVSRERCAAQALRWTWNGESLQQDRIIGGEPSILTLRNTTDRKIVIVLEENKWGHEAVTAHHVALQPEFRSLFSSEVLAPGLQAGISTVAVMFTDLCGSTAYYEQAGDAPAYGYVKRMFQLVKDVVERHQGCVVKTIGDEVMAVFDRGEDAFQAACDIQRGWRQTDGPLLRAALARGPAVAIGANGAVDYFGRTINLAARIQSAAQAGEIVMEDSFLTLQEMHNHMGHDIVDSGIEEMQFKGFQARIRIRKVKHNTGLEAELLPVQ